MNRIIQHIATQQKLAQEINQSTSITQNNSSENNFSVNNDTSVKNDASVKNNPSEKKKDNKPKGNYYYNAQQMVAKNERLFNEGKVDKCRFFEYKGYKIFNPFKDETGSKEVDPKDYYGDAYNNSEFNKIN